MKSLAKSIEAFIASLTESNEYAKKEKRAAFVQSTWQHAVQKVYGDAAEFILSHTNAVYILFEQGEKCLVVYSDDSLVRSDLDARQEFIKLHFRSAGEDVASFRILASRFGMKDRHPFSASDKDSTEVSKLFEKAVRTPLSVEKEREVARLVSVVEDERLREALKAAIVAELEFHGKK